MGRYYLRLTNTDCYRLRCAVVAKKRNQLDSALYNQHDIKHIYIEFRSNSKNIDSDRAGSYYNVG